VRSLRPLESAAVTGTPFEDQIDSVVRRLTATLDVPPAIVEAEVRAAFEEWGDARVRDFVPIFVERELRERHDLETTQSPGG
jgi:hypothetical protein